VLRRLKLNRIRDIEPQLPPNRYEHAAPGDMLHLDIKRLVRIQRPSHRVTGNRRDSVKGIGAEFLHVAIDDHSRIAFTAMYPDQTERSSTHFLTAAVAWYEGLGIAIRKVLTDNGPCYKANRFARVCGELGLKHRRTRPYTPRTNGKAERFIKTAINEWAYARTFQLEFFLLCALFGISGDDEALPRTAERSRAHLPTISRDGGALGTERTRCEGSGRAVASGFRNSNPITQAARKDGTDQTREEFRRRAQSLD
jgi:transposase InsO family protein